MLNINVPDKYWAECPTCGAEIHYDGFQYDGNTANIVKFICTGYCHGCQKEYGWTEKFILTEITPLESI